MLGALGHCRLQADVQSKAYRLTRRDSVGQSMHSSLQWCDSSSQFQKPEDL